MRIRGHWALWLILLVVGAAAQSACVRRAASSWPNLEIPVRCASAITLLGCDARVSPPRCRSARVTYARGCEQIVVKKQLIR